MYAAADSPDFRNLKKRSAIGEYFLPVIYNVGVCSKPHFPPPYREVPTPTILLIAPVDPRRRRIHVPPLPGCVEGHHFAILDPTIRRADVYLMAPDEVLRYVVDYFLPFLAFSINPYLRDDPAYQRHTAYRAGEIGLWA